MHRWAKSVLCIDVANIFWTPPQVISILFLSLLRGCCWLAVEHHPQLDSSIGLADFYRRPQYIALHTAFLSFNCKLEVSNLQQAHHHYYTYDQPSIHPAIVQNVCSVLSYRREAPFPTLLGCCSIVAVHSIACNYVRIKRMTGMLFLEKQPCTALSVRQLESVDRYRTMSQIKMISSDW